MSPEALKNYVGSRGMDILAKGRLVFDAASCRTCRVCEQVCAISHEGYARPAIARINVLFDEFAPPEQMITAVYCRQCADAPCMAACPNDALTRHPVNGAVVVNEDKCTGCMRCRKACEWRVPKLHPERQVAVKCDLCAENESGPVCVQFCPVVGKALTYDAHYYVREAERAAL